MDKGKQRPQGHKRGKNAQKEANEEAKKQSLSRREEAEVAQLQKKIADVLPAPGTVENEFKDFSQLPLCRYTVTGLSRGKFTAMTQIQRAAIPHALGGRDILGAAKTGSGKTLAFIIPILERLYHARWSAADGLGAVIISPTRELAMQIFEVLRTVGQSHFSLSAGLITGGKDFEEEKAAIGRMTILVATPGRLLQHLEQSPDLDPSGLRVLVLDEADRLLDMGFSDTINSIMKYMPGPPQRQTLLFSATQTKSVRDLARLSLKSPEYIAVHDKAEAATPSRLTQHYVVTQPQDKLNMLFSFLRTHTHNKSIIFVSSCKESRFLFESFRRLRPGVPLQLLHGKMKQTRRMLVYYDFLKKPAAALFATDVAARGLDFTGVDWVLQLDCPEDTATYIHRVGRTARFTAKGHALAVFTPSEAKGMVPLLQEAKIPVAEIRINPNSAISVTGKLAAEVAADPSLKQLAQRSFSSYLRSVALAKNKDIFRAQDIDLDALAESMGLATTPEVSIARYAGSGTASNAEATAVTLGDAAKMTPEQAEALRKEAHARKNSNKALAKLKEKIAAEKALRKAKASGAGMRGSDDEDMDEDSDVDDNDEDDELGSDSEDYSDSDDDGDGSDGDIDDGGHRRAGAGASSSAKQVPKATGKVKPPGTAAAANQAAPRHADADDDLLVRKKRASSTGSEGEHAGSGSGAASGLALRVSEAELAGMSARERARVLRVIRETHDLAAEVEAGGVGKDGLTPFQRIALAKQGELGQAGKANDSASSKGKKNTPELQDAAAAHVAKIAARLASRADIDRETERARVKEKHRKDKLAARGLTDEDVEQDEDEDGGVRLAGASDDEDDRSGSEDNDDDDEDDGMDSGSGSEDEDEEPAQRARQMVAVTGAGSKRPRGEPAQAKAPAAAPAPPSAPATVEDLEAAALAKMAGKAKKPRTG